jgi:nucleoid-associated protein YejK
MDDVKEKLILGKLKNVQNVATLMKDYFKPFDQFVEDKNFTINEAINAKESTHKYLNKYGAFMLEATVRGIENIINGNFQDNEYT